MVRWNCWPSSESGEGIRISLVVTFCGIADSQQSWMNWRTCGLDRISSEFNRNVFSALVFQNRGFLCSSAKIIASAYRLANDPSRSLRISSLFGESTESYFLEGDFFCFTFLALAVGFFLVAFFFFSPKALLQLSEYFLVVPLRRIVIGLSCWMKIQ